MTLLELAAQALPRPRDWVGGRRRPVAEAAYVNGVAAHALDLDDVSMAMSGHPSALLVPVSVAVGEARGRTSGCAGT